MSRIDKIIADKLHGATDYPVNDSMWSSIEKELPSSGVSGVANNFRSALIGGIAASTLFGILFATLPNPEEVNGSDQERMATSQKTTIESSIVKSSESVFAKHNAFSPQEEHEIVFVSSRTEAVVPTDQHDNTVEATQKNTSDKEVASEQMIDEPVPSKKVNALKSVETPSFDFKAIGIQCSGEVIAFKTDAKADNVEWVIDGVDVLQGAHVEHEFDYAGMHEVVMLIDNKGHSTSVRKEIEIYEQPKPQITSQVVYSTDCFEQKVDLDANPKDNQYTWRVGDKEFIGAEISTQLLEGSYHVSLTTINAHGCLSDQSELLAVEEGKEVFVPNSFSPLDQNGRNDTWFPVGLKGTDQFTLRIYNVAQNLVYETSEIEPWDGLLSNTTQKVSQGQQYFYALIVEDNCGSTKKYDGVINIR